LVEENRELTRAVYNSASADENLSYRYMNEWFDVLKMQINKAGIRLAVLLNNIYA